MPYQHYQNILNILEKFKDDINNFKFDSLYKHLIKSGYGKGDAKSSIGEITDIFFNIGINPFKYMDEIPYIACRGSEQTYIEIPNNIKLIGSQAFEESNIEKVIIPASVIEVIGFSCSNCYNLKSAIFEGAYTKVGSYNFVNCEKLEEVKLPSKLKELPNGLFKGCKSLVSIDIPNTVRQIGKEVFLGCDSLKYFNFLGTKNDFEHIRIEDLFARDGFAAYVPKIICIDGEYEF